MRVPLCLAACFGALLAAIATGSAVAETAVPFEQVFNLGNDQGVKIELDFRDDVLVFNGGTFILWGRNLEIHAGRIRVNADTVIQAFPRGAVDDLATDGAPGGPGADGSPGGSGYAGIPAGTVLLRGTSIEGSGRLIVLNDGMDGGAGGGGGAGGQGTPGGPGSNTQCTCEATSCTVSSCLGSILPETGAAGVEDPVMAQSLSGYLKLMQESKVLQSQPTQDGQTPAWLQTFMVCKPQTNGTDGQSGHKGGDGGDGGAGGAGGTGGNVAYVPELQSALDRGQIVASVAGGVGGKSGRPGQPGEGGPGGNGGLKGCEQQSRFELGPKGETGAIGKAGAQGKSGDSGQVYVIQD